MIHSQKAWDAFDRADPLARELQARTRSLLQATRHAQGPVPERLKSVTSALDALRAELLRGAQDGLDPREFHGDVERARAVIQHLEGLTSSKVKEVAGRTFEIGPTDLPDVLTLLILARPEGMDYMNLARATHDHLEELVATRRDRAALRARWVLRAVIPTHAFGNGPSYPSAPRGADRATHVESITAAGLPSLGRRA